MSRPSLSIIVFAFDEEENVGAVLRELCTWLRANEPGAQIVLVDDGSRDATLEAAEDALSGFPHRSIRHTENRGIGAALKSGVELAEGDWVTFLPADGQIEPGAVGTLRRAAADDEADVVLSVYDDRDDGLDRTILSAGVRALITIVHGVRLRSDGPYLFRRRLFIPAELPPDSFFLNFELPIRVLAAGLRVRTVRIACRPRRAGASKSTGFRRIWSVARDLVELRLRRTRHAMRLFAAWGPR